MIIRKKSIYSDSLNAIKTTLTTLNSYQIAFSLNSSLTMTNSIQILKMKKKGDAEPNVLIPISSLMESTTFSRSRKEGVKVPDPTESQFDTKFLKRISRNSFSHSKNLAIWAITLVVGFFSLFYPLVQDKIKNFIKVSTLKHQTRDFGLGYKDIYSPQPHKSSISQDRDTNRSTKRSLFSKYTGSRTFTEDDPAFAEPPQTNRKITFS